MRCPWCSRRFPAYRPVPEEALPGLLARLPPPRVFYFDLLSRFAILLAKAWSSQGTLVVFEPFHAKPIGLYRQCAAVAHVVKYSAERRAHLPDVPTGPNAILVVETLGAEGLRFRAKQAAGDAEWYHVPGYRLPAVRDAAGCGDWCTVGLIERLGREGHFGLEAASSQDVEEACRFGQALSAWNCGYPSARGGMYSGSREDMEQIVQGIRAGRIREMRDLGPKGLPSVPNPKSLCANCCGPRGN